LYPNRRGEAAPSFTSEAVLPKLAEKSAAWIREHKERPFFLYLPLNSPHTPLNPNQAWRGKSGLGSYADFVMETDWLVGEIMRTLDETKLADQTLVIFTSDNGCAPYVGTSAEIDPMPHGRGDVHSLEKQGHYPSGDLRGYKSDIWEGGHRVPFIVRWPQQVPAGSRCTQLVGQLDLMATCAEITGAKLPENAAEDSVSILPLLQGKNVPVRESLVHHSIQGAFAIRQGNWKLALCRGSGGWSAGGDDHSTQLYDLSHDLGEQTNLAAAQPEMVARLTNLSEKQVADGRSTPGTPQKNDAEIVIRKPRDSREFKPARANKLP
jgi:arylsulfatase A-like enzyme